LASWRPRGAAGAPRGSRWRIYPRHRLDLSFTQLVFALAACLRPGDAEGLERRIEAGIGPGGIVCSSLRSGFELLLQALSLPSGSEVIISSVTHPDMVRILERHELVPVPVDLEPETLGPSRDSLEAATTPKSRAVLIAHLFGGRVDMAPVRELAAERGLLVLEDCAQSLRGSADRGDEHSDVSMFSFGSIKTSSALGGGILVVRRPELLQSMRALRSGWPRQGRPEYAVRVLRFFGLIGLQNPTAYGLFVRLGATVGLDMDALVNRSVSGRPPSSAEGEAFARWLHRRPAQPLLALLRRRLRTFDSVRLARRAALGEELAARLPCQSLPGRAALDRTYWVFPVVSDDPPRLIEILRSNGFDAIRATTSIAAVGSPPPPRATELMDRVVFVPAYPELPRAAVDRLADALEQGAR
jgi:perosamine synthetase